MSDLTKPTPSPWRTDIENAPRDGRKIFIIDCTGNYYVVYPDCGLGNYDWQSNEYCFDNENITHWTPIPELPTI